MEMKIISRSGRVPAYETKGAAGFDIAAYLEEPVTLEPGMRMLVPTGLFFEVPEGYEAQVRARSGLAVKYGIGLVNGIGTVDADYRGEVKVPLINWGSEPFVIRNGERIAQVVINRIEQVELVPAEELSETERGAGGFGHTGVEKTYAYRRRGDFICCCGRIWNSGRRNGSGRRLRKRPKAGDAENGRRSARIARYFSGTGTGSFIRKLSGA